MMRILKLIGLRTLVCVDDVFSPEEDDVNNQGADLEDI